MFFICLKIQNDPHIFFLVTPIHFNKKVHLDLHTYASHYFHLTANIFESGPMKILGQAATASKL